DNVGKVVEPFAGTTVSELVWLSADPVVVVAIAVIVVVLDPPDVATAVARPAWLIVATPTSLETQRTWLVRSCNAVPLPKVPKARNCVVSPACPALATPSAGMIANDAGSTPAVDTVMSVVTVLPLNSPVMIVLPAPLAVARPVALIVATLAL